MIRFHEDLHFKYGVIEGTTLQNLVFSNGLHGKLLASTFQFAQIDATKAALAYLHVQVEVVKCDRGHR